MTLLLRDLKTPTGDQADNAALRLGRAWEFLAAEQRTFTLAKGPNGHFPFTDFGFFMFLAVDDRVRAGGVGVLLGRDNTTRVASHMFDLPRSKIKEADLYDAGSESCNLLADCVAQEFAPGLRVRLSLPILATALEYAEIIENSKPRTVYHCHTQDHDLRIVLYDSLPPKPKETP